MRKTLYFIGSALWSIVSSCLLWMVFRLYAPRFVSMFFWGPALERSYALGGPLAALIACLAVAPLPWLCVNKACKIAATVFLSFSGFCALLEPWYGTMPGSDSNFVALLMSVVGVAIYSFAIFLVWAAARKVDFEDEVKNEDTLGS